jgi:hypothetical protein
LSHLKTERADGSYCKRERERERENNTTIERLSNVMCNCSDCCSVGEL